MSKKGVEIKVIDIVCPKPPNLFIKEELAYKRALLAVDQKELATKNGAATASFRVEFIKQVGSESYKNFNQYP